MGFLQAVWPFIEAHWAAILLGGVGAALLNKALTFADSTGVAFLVAEMERVRKVMNSNSLLGQIAADDAVVDCLEKAIPNAIHEVDDAVRQTINSGDLHQVDWVALGKDVWKNARQQIKGGYHDYLQSSSFKQDGEVLAAEITKRFFVKQKVAATGLIADAPRAAVTDVKTTTVQTVEATPGLPPGQVTSQEVHTETGAQNAP